MKIIYDMNVEEFPRYIFPSAIFDGNDYSIARGLQAIGKNNQNPLKDELFLKGIYIGENTFIGTRATILPGTYIGKDVIVGACSVVKGNIPDNSIVIGNPARIYAKTTEWVKKKYNEHEDFIED